MLGFVAGVILGALFGIIPGLHPNLAISMMSGIGIPEFVAAFAAANLIFDSFPAVLTGVSEQGREISNFRSKLYYLHGMALYGIRRIAYATLSGFVMAAVASPVLLPLSSGLYSIIKDFIPFIVLAISAWNIATDMPHSITLFGLSAMLGYLSLDISGSNITPLLTGLFGMPLVIGSILSPAEKISQSTQVPLPEPMRGLKRGVVLGAMAGLLPAIGPSQMVFLVSHMPLDYTVFSSSLSASSTIYSVLSLLTTGKARSGIAVAMRDRGVFLLHDAIEFLIYSLMAAGLSAFLVSIAVKPVVGICEKLGQRALSILSLATISAISYWVSGMSGIITLAAATGLGIYADHLKSRKTHLLGCLIYPTLVYYFIGM